MQDKIQTNGTPMIVLSGTAVFWFMALGLLVGYLFGQIIKHEGVTLGANIIWGILASVLTGSIAIILELGDGLIFALLGTLTTLFLVNVFHQHHVEDVYGHADRGMRLRDR